MTHVTWVAHRTKDGYSARRKWRRMKGNAVLTEVSVHDGGTYLDLLRMICLSMKNTPFDVEFNWEIEP